MKPPLIPKLLNISIDSLEPKNIDILDKHELKLFDNINKNYDNKYYVKYYKDAKYPNINYNEYNGNYSILYKKNEDRFVCRGYIPNGKFEPKIKKGIKWNTSNDSDWSNFFNPTSSSDKQIVEALWNKDMTLSVGELLRGTRDKFVNELWQNGIVGTNMFKYFNLVTQKNCSTNLVSYPEYNATGDNLNILLINYIDYLFANDKGNASVQIVVLKDYLNTTTVPKVQFDAIIKNNKTRMDFFKKNKQFIHNFIKMNSDKIKNLLGFEFKKTVINAIEDLCDAFEKINIKDSFSEEWSNIKVLTKMEKNK